MRFHHLRVFSRISLRTQLTALMLSMLAASLWAGYWVSSRVERDALNEVRNSVEALSKAVDVSVQQLHFGTGSSEAYLISFQATLQSRGLRQITLYNADGDVLARTPLAKGPEEENLKDGLYRTLDVSLPVVSGTRLLGYVDLKFSLANFQVLFNNMHWSKTMFSLAIFALGLVIVWPLAGVMTHSFRGIRSASQQVANGELEVRLPQPSDRDTAALITSFERMVDKLRQQRALETRFAAAEREAAVGRMASGIAHDIRNPLNYVKLAVQEVQARLRKRSDSVATGDLLDGVCAEIGRIEETMQDLLDFGRPVVPSLSLENPHQILEESVGDVRRRHPDEGLDIQVGSNGGDGTVYVDPALLRRALVNVIENAVEASPAGGPVKAGWELREEGNDGLGVFWVQDSGPGIPAENLEKIFVPYFTTKASGVGLGLALTGKWVEEMGGRIQVANQPGGGARFEFQFPVREPQST